MGAGGSKSKSNTNIKTRNIVNALVENIMNCQSNTTTKQTFTVSGSYNVIKNSKQVLAITLSSACAQSASNIADMQQAVSSAIQQAVQSQSVSVLGALGGSTATANTIIKNDVEQNITQSNIQNIINATNLQQSIVISGDNNIIDNFTQEQTAALLFTNCQNVINEMKSIQTLNNVSEQQTTATQTNFVSDIISSLTAMLSSGLFFLVIIIGIGAYVLLKSPTLMTALIPTIQEEPQQESQQESQ